MTMPYDPHRQWVREDSPIREYVAEHQRLGDVIAELLDAPTRDREKVEQLFTEQQRAATSLVGAVDTYLHFVDRLNGAT